jgi:ATP-dependent Clp protease, protease subunit
MSMPPALEPTLPEAPPVYAVFCGMVEQITAQKFVSFLTASQNMRHQHVHVLFQTAGGFVSDGVFLYNFFRAMSVELSLYNAGQVSSAGVIAYLGASHRITNAGATFMVHRSSNSATAAGSAKLQNIAKSLVLDDERTETILKAHVALPQELWTEMQYHNVFLSANDAVQFGMADGIGDFSPPKGFQVFNVLP